MRGNNHISVITERKVIQVKKLLKKYSPLPHNHPGRPIGALSIRYISKITNIPYNTVWRIKDGVYKIPKIAKVKKSRSKFFRVNERPCWITGFNPYLKIGTKRILTA